MENEADAMVHRYVMVELSCDQKACAPCTYPNCQRYARAGKKIKTPKGSQVVKVTELNKEEALKKLSKSHGKT